MRSEEPVSRIMTETVVVIDADRPVGEVRECFSQYPIHHLPVVRDGRLVGMLSSADVSKLEFGTRKAAANDASGAGGGITIASLMQSSPIRLGPHASIGEAAERLVESGVHAVPIVDDADRVIGIVTTSDVIRSLLHGPPRRGVLPPSRPAPASTDPEDEPQYQRKPTDAEYLVALQTAEVLHVEARDLRHLGKTLLYLDQRRRYLEKVLELADRFLLTGQDEHVHALLLKAIHAAKRAEEHAGSGAGTPFPLE